MNVPALTYKAGYAATARALISNPDFYNEEVVRGILRSYRREDYSTDDEFTLAGIDALLDSVGC